MVNLTRFEKTLKGPQPRTSQSPIGKSQDMDQEILEDKLVLPPRGSQHIRHSYTRTKYQK